MHSSNEEDAPAAAAAAALSSRDSAYSTPPEHTTAVWDRQGLSREKFDRDRYSSAKREWSADSRSSSYRSPGLLASGSVSASFNKRRAVGRHESVENGRYRSTVGRSESSSSLRSPSQVVKAERDACSPVYGNSPIVERPSKSLDGHHHRDGRLSPGSSRPLSSPRIDSRLHGNHNEADASGAWDREKSRFSSPSCGWEVSNRGRDYRERAWSRPDIRRPYPLPKLDSSKDWSQSDRELLEGRIDRYSGVSGREMSFSDVVSGNSRESTRNDWKGRERVLQSGIPAYSPASNLFNRDPKSFSLAPDAMGPGSPPLHSPLQSSFSHDSDLDTGLVSSKKRPRLTWGQGLAKYEKEKTGEEFSVAKKSEEGSNCAGGLHSDGSVASTLPDFSLQPINAVFISDDIQQQQSQMGNLDVSVDGITHFEHQYSNSHDLVAVSSVMTSDLSTLTELHHGDAIDLKNSGQSDLSDSIRSDIPESRELLLHYMRSFISRCADEQLSLSKDTLTQHVERVELEIDRMEKELAKLDNEVDNHGTVSEIAAVSAVGCSEVSVLEPLGLDSKESPIRSPKFVVDNMSVDPDSNEEFATRPPVYLTQDHDAFVKDIPRVGNDCICGGELSATLNDASCGLETRASTPSFVGPNKADDSFRDSGAGLLSSNQQIAKESLDALAHLGASSVGISIYSDDFTENVQHTDCWKQNSESHVRNGKLMHSRIFDKTRLQKFVEGVLAIRYRAKREAWKQEQISSLVTSEKSFDKMEYEYKGNITPNQHSPSTVTSSPGLCVPDACSEEIQVVKTLLVERPFDIVREYVKMPAMVVGQKHGALHSFESKNGLVEDPVAAELERKSLNPWSAEEKKIFLEKYSLLGKNLRKIASYLEHKTVADCVQFFYQNQKSEEFEKIHRRHKLRKRREARSSALYLATSTSVVNNHYESNGSYVEGLSLVAAAAAAMSFPRSLRSPAMKSSLSGNTSSRVCREMNVVRQVADASLKDNLGEETCSKYQAIPYRRFKKSSDEVLQWKSQWNNNERELFLNAVALYGKDFDRISAYIGSKSAGQCKAYFSKARKRLGLDQLVERQRDFLLDSRQPDNNGTNSSKMEFQTEADLNSKVGGEASESLKPERSPLCMDPCPSPEMRSDCFQENSTIEPVLGISSPKSSLAVDLTGSSGLCHNSGQPVVDIPMINGAVATGFGIETTAESSCISVKLRNGPPDFVQGCVNDDLVGAGYSQSKVEPRISMSEAALAPSCTAGASHSISSHGTASPRLLSAPMSHPGHSLQVKERSGKSMEVKVRREPTSWTLEEKETFADILKVHGKNWDLLCKSLPAKSLVQIKTYFQNSKAKLGFGSESVINSGRGSSSWKRKMDDTDSANNVGPGLQTLPQKGIVPSEDGNLKVSPNMLSTSGGSGSNMLAAEAAYANMFLKNAQKVFHAMGLGQSGSTPGMVPMLTSAVFPPPTLVSAQQPFLQQTVSPTVKIPQVLNHQQPEQSGSSMMVVEPNSAAAIQQVHQLPSQQQVAVTCQDHPLTGVPPGCNKQSSQLEQLSLLQQVQPPNQQLQQVADTVLQQLLPQAVQRHQQQLQLSGQQLPHFPQVHSHHQVQSNWSAQSQVASAAAVSLVPGQQLPQQTTLVQPHLHHAHGKRHSHLQQHQQLPSYNQLQILQRQRQQQQHQQQQQQLLLHLQQQAQVLSQPHQIHNQAILVQQNHSFNTEQQQPALFRGFPPISSGSGEGFKQNDDFQLLAKSQQGAFGNVHQLNSSNQVSEPLISPPTVSETQLPASDVKLFGQSLLSQPVSGYQHVNAKLSSTTSPTGVAFAVPPSSIVGSRSSNAASSTPWDRVFPGQGQGWQQSMSASAHSNGNARCVLAGEPEVGSSSVQDRVSSCSERPNVEGADNIDGRAGDAKADLTLCQLPDGHLSSSAIVSLVKGTTSSGPSFTCGLSNITINQNDAQKSGNLDHLLTQSLSRKQDLNSATGSSGGDVTVSQGLPRVLDAFATLAEWRVQNSSGCSDEFLSQYWEALQKNPGSLIEAGRTGGSLSQLYLEGPQMLQHLRERLLSSHTSLGYSQSSAGSTGVPGVENSVLLINGQRAPVQTVSVTRINEGDLTHPEECVTMQIDGNGGAVS